MAQRPSVSDPQPIQTATRIRCSHCDHHHHHPCLEIRQILVVLKRQTQTFSDFENKNQSLQQSRRTSSFSAYKGKSRSLHRYFHANITACPRGPECVALQDSDRGLNTEVLRNHFYRTKLAIYWQLHKQVIFTRMENRFRELGFLRAVGERSDHTRQQDFPLNRERW